MYMCVYYFYDIFTTTAAKIHMENIDARHLQRGTYMIFDERMIRNRQINRVYDKSERTMAQSRPGCRTKEIGKYVSAYIRIYVYVYTDASTRRSWKSSHGYRVEATGYSEPLRVSCAIRYPRIIVPRFRSSCNVKRHCRQRMNQAKRKETRATGGETVRVIECY